jgi:hypothetical protein
LPPHHRHSRAGLLIPNPLRVGRRRFFCSLRT